MRHLSYVIFGLLILSVAGTALAAECPATLPQAIAAANEVCQDTGRNQVCYGYGEVSADFQPGFEDQTFSQPGDIIDAGAIQTITTLTSDNAGSEWGVALMRLQLNMPNELPDQNVSILLLGDVTIENAIAAVAAAPVPPPPPTLNVTAANQANVRSGPSTNVNVVGSLSAGETLVGDGRNADATWVHIQLADGGSGWVFAELVSLDGDINTLNVVTEETPVEEEEAPVVVPPMSNFTIRTGDGTSACAGELPSGIVVQSPDRQIPDEAALVGSIPIPSVTFTMNNVEIVMGSTFWAEAQAGANAVVNVVEDFAQATANGASQFSRAGGQIELPADDSGDAPALNPDWSPADLEPLINLFENLEAAAELVPRPVDVETNVSPAEDDWAEVFTENYKAGTLVVPEGFWHYWRADTTFVGDCYMNPSFFAPEIRITTLDDVLEVDDLGIVTGIVTGDGVWPVTPSFPGQYVYSEVVEIVATQITIGVHNPLQITYMYVGDIDDGVQHCQTITPIFLTSCLMDLMHGTTRGDGLCPAETHRAMGTYGKK
jgi:uncharacterized protein YraI